MTRLKMFIPLLFLLITACDFRNAASTSPSRSVDRFLLRQWVNTAQNKKLVISRQSSKTYKVVYEDANAATTYYGHHINMGGYDYIQLKGELDGDPRPYVYLTYKKVHNQIYVERLDNTKFSADASTAQLQKYLASGDRAFFTYYDTFK